MSREGPSRMTGRMVAGGILITLGVLFTLDNFGVVEARELFRYWPVLLLGFGLLKISQARYSEQRVAGAAVAAVGVLLLLRTLHVLSFHIRQVWPIFLVVGGALLVWRSLRGRDPEGVLASARRRLPGDGLGDPAAGGFYLNEFAFLGGGERVIRSPDFRGGEVTAIMGGFEIDLRGSTIVGSEAVLDTFTLWGGVEIRVPEEWEVEIRGVPILGGFSETSHGPAPAAAAAATVPRKRFVVRGTAIMGGVEVKR